MEEIKIYLKKSKEYLEKYINKYIPPTLEPKILKESMEYSLEGGKRIRGILTLTIGRMFNAKEENLIPFSVAIEYIHAYSLVHDDLPALDNDDYRRGRLSTHKRFGEAMGILCGDALLTHAFWIIASQTEDKVLVPDLVELLSWRAGVGGMLTGQVSDILAEKGEKLDNILTNGDSKKVLNFIHYHKTAALISCSCEAGGIIGKATYENIKNLRNYGECIGLAFQIVDDILDVIGDEKKLGKKVRKDKEKGKLTYPEIYGLEKSKQKAKELIENACDYIKNIPKNEHLIKIANFIISRDY